MLNTIDNLKRDLLWGSTDANRKFDAISWTSVTKPKSMGGLDIQNSELNNRVAMAKLNQRFHTKQTSLWAEVLKEKY